MTSPSTKAPERIWTWSWPQYVGLGQWSCRVSGGTVEYIRADLHVSPAAMLDLWDRSLSGAALTAPERQQVRQMVLAAAYGVAAYHCAMDTDEGAHAMMRAVLLALVDPMHPDLDYLRAAAGAGINDGGRDG